MEQPPLVSIVTPCFNSARFLQRTIEVMLYQPFADESLPIIDAQFDRGGHSLSTVEERVQSAGDSIILSWWNLLPPFVPTISRTTTVAPAGLATGTATATISAKEQRIREARLKGYEGDPCPRCFNFTLVRSGACAKCDTCGETSGCG